MRPLVLLVSHASDIWPLRAAVLASRGYVISPATSVARALAILNGCSMAVAVLGQSLGSDEKTTLIEKSRSLAIQTRVVCIHGIDEGHCGADFEILNTDGPTSLIDAVEGCVKLRNSHQTSQS